MKSTIITESMIETKSQQLVKEIKRMIEHENETTPIKDPLGIKQGENGWSRFMLHSNGNGRYCLVLSSPNHLSYNLEVINIIGTNRYYFHKSQLSEQILSDPDFSSLIRVSLLENVSNYDANIAHPPLIQYLMENARIQLDEKDKDDESITYDIFLEGAQEPRLTASFRESASTVVLDNIKDYKKNAPDSKNGYGTWIICWIIQYCIGTRKKFIVRHVRRPEVWERYQLLTRKIWENDSAEELYMDQEQAKIISLHIQKIIQYHKQKLFMNP